MAECVCNYGPLQEFWTFLFERLNKVLKSFKTGNHTGGELETTFFHEFHRTVHQSHLVSHINTSAKGTSGLMCMIFVAVGAIVPRGTRIGHASCC